MNRPARRFRASLRDATQRLFTTHRARDVVRRSRAHEGLLLSCTRDELRPLRHSDREEAFEE